MLKPDDWKRVEALFHQACDLSPPERERFMREHVADHPAMRAELEKMLEAAAAATERLNKPLAEASVRPTARDVPEPAAGARFGPWEVDRLLGKGGMGHVYLGHRADGAYEREVAIKVIGAHDHPRRVRDYFEFERQMLARMQHPAIAQIFDAGSDVEGRLYLVMEYIDGASLMRWCHEHRVHLRQRIRLLIQVADGVQHAHQKGVVHRDLKPGNILVGLVDGQPVPKIIDFGIAARIDTDDRIEAAGTPGYMSPEQATSGMDVDSRSDVYALGAILFELVSGRRPVHSGSDTSQAPLRPSDRISTLTPDEISQLSEALDTPVPRLRRTLRDDLDWIVAKATQPERDLRYASAAAFAEDLQRWLDGYPPHSAPPQRLRAWHKFVRRNRLGVATATTALVAILAGLATSTWAWQQAQRAMVREQAVSHFLTDVLTSIDPVLSHDLDQALMRRVLETASMRIATDLADEPEARVRIESTLSSTYANLGDRKRALNHAQTALDIARTQLGPNRLATLNAGQELAYLLTLQGELQQAEALLRELLPHASGTARENPVLEPRIQSRLGWNLRMQGRLDEALPLLRTGYETLLQRVGPDHPRSIDAGQYYAIALEGSGDLPGAIILMQDLVERQARQLGNDHPQTLALRNSLANFQLESGDFAAAETELRALIEVIGQQHGTATAMLPVLQVNLASALQEKGTPDALTEAGLLYQHSVDAQLAQQGPDNPQSITMRRMRTEWLVQVGQLQAARLEWEAIVASARKVFGEKHARVADNLRSLAEVELALGAAEDARTHAKAALALLAGSNDQKELTDKLDKLLASIDATPPGKP